jgi:hypothetical protein
MVPPGSQDDVLAGAVPVGLGKRVFRDARPDDQRRAQRRRETGALVLARIRAQAVRRGWIEEGAPPLIWRFEDPASPSDPARQRP